MKTPKPKDKRTKIAQLVRKFYAWFRDEFVAAKENDHKADISLDRIDRWMWENGVLDKPTEDKFSGAGYRSQRVLILNWIRSYAESLTPSDEKSLGVPMFALEPSMAKDATWVIILKQARAKDGHRKTKRLSKHIIRQSKQLSKTYGSIAEDPSLSTEEKVFASGTNLQAETFMKIGAVMIDFAETQYNALKQLTSTDIRGILPPPTE